VSAEESDDWPFLRGPKFNGHSSETGLVDRWPSSGPPVLWTRSLGQGYSGFVVSGDRAYTQRQTLAGQTVICLNARDGSTVWEYRYDFPYEAAGLYPGPRSTPTLARGRIYFTGTDGLVGCLSLDGRRIWEVKTAERFQMQPPGFGYANSPVVVDELLLLPVGGRGASLVALHADTGATIWQAGDDPASYTPAFPIVHQGRSLVIGYLENALVAHDLRTGRPAWREDLSTGYDEHAAWPIYREPHLWFSAPFQAGCRLVRLNDDGQRIERVWSRRRMMSNDVVSSVLVGDHLFGFDLRDPQSKVHRPSRGSFRCIEFLTGESVWETTETGHVSVLVADGKLILLNDTGSLILARATPDRYEELARCPVLPGEIGWTPPALHRKRLFVRNHSQAVCVYLGPLDELTGLAADRPLRTTSEIPQRRYQDWSQLLGVEPEYAMDVPTQTWLKDWYAINLALLVGSLLTASGLALLLRRPTWRDPAFRLLAGTAGAIGTTWISPWRGDFTFTWMLTVFVLLDLVVSVMPQPGAPVVSRWKARLLDCVFLAVCFAHYWLCRRLSLVTQWSFLVGMLPAVPVLAIARGRAASSPRATLWIDAGRLLAFTVLYLTAVLLMAAKYSIPY